MNSAKARLGSTAMSGANGKVAKPSSEVKEGDMLDILMGGKHTVVKVTSVQEFTTKAAAAEMYEMITRGDLE